MIFAELCFDTFLGCELFCKYIFGSTRDFKENAIGQLILCRVGHFTFVFQDCSGDDELSSGPCL